MIEPLGKVQNVERLLSVGNEDDGSDVINVLRAYEPAWGHRMRGFQLQRKVDDIAAAVSGLFDGERFVDQVKVNLGNQFGNLLSPVTAVGDQLQVRVG